MALAALVGCELPGWAVVHRELPAGMTSVWGTSARDVWAVGGDAGDGEGPWVLHHDGARWRRMKTGASGDLWWVFGFEGGPVFLGGAGGLMLRYRDGAFERMQTPGLGTVFGIWGTAPDALWAVGGSGGGAGAFAWRFDGSRWSEAAGFPAELPRSVTLFKVWGRGANDVWMVGSSGSAVHFDGQAFTSFDLGTAESLFTVHASRDRFAAVGGFASGTILENDGSGWISVTPPGTRQLNGVFLTDAEGWAVGSNGQVYRRGSDGWRMEQTELAVNEDLHSVWVDPDGGVWAVGGQLMSIPLRRGTMIHKGRRIPGGRYE